MPTVVAINAQGSSRCSRAEAPDMDDPIVGSPPVKRSCAPATNAPLKKVLMTFMPRSPKTTSTMIPIPPSESEFSEKSTPRPDATSHSNRAKIIAATAFRTGRTSSSRSSRITVIDDFAKPQVRRNTEFLSTTGSCCSRLGCLRQASHYGIAT